MTEFEFEMLEDWIDANIAYGLAAYRTPKERFRADDEFAEAREIAYNALVEEA